MANLSDRIKSLRLSAEMTQEEFGKKFGIVKSTVSLYESGKSTPNDQIKKQICDYFHVSLDYLLGVDRQGGLDYANFQIDESEFALDFKMRIRELISEQGMTEDDFMQNTGFSKDEKDAYLYGNKMPSIEDLIKIAGALNVSTDYLLNISSRKRISSQEESLLQKFNRCDEDSQQYLLAKAGVLCVEGISAVAAGEYGKYADEEKSFPSSGTEGKGLKKNNRTIGGILWYGLQLGPILLSASCLDGLGFINSEKRKLAWVSFTYVHSDCFVSDGLLTASGTCWQHFMGNASRATDQCRFQQMLHYQLCHQM